VDFQLARRFRNRAARFVNHTLRELTIGARVLFTNRAARFANRLRVLKIRLGVLEKGGVGFFFLVVYFTFGDCGNIFYKLRSMNTDEC